MPWLWGSGVVVFTCPPREDISQPKSSEPSSNSEDPELSRPDLRLTVNFTELLSSSDQSGYRGMVADSLKVFLALTNDTNNVLFSTPVTYLLPGTNLVGIADFMVRQRFKAAQLSTLGLFDVSL
jgi:hypothetical protein